MWLVAFLTVKYHFSRYQFGHKPVFEDIFGPIFEKVTMHIQAPMSLKLHVPSLLL